MTPQSHGGLATPHPFIQEHHSTQTLIRGITPDEPEYGDQSGYGEEMGPMGTWGKLRLQSRTWG
jgi:hypothetical protein